ncbi:MAG TPA: ATP-binding protein [Paucimonas sp.]|nr:ATP-binding protein [Paucimonas sp.]
MVQEPHSHTTQTRETFWRTLQTFAVTRIVIAIVLLLYLVFNLRKESVVGNYLVYWESCFGYLIAATGFAFLAVRYRRHFLMQLWVQIAADLAIISILYTSVSGTHSSLAVLYLFPLAGGAILSPLLHALFFAAAATIFLLTESAYQILELTADASMSHAGLYGAAFFATAIVVNRLAARLITEEALARQRGIDLRLQEAINRLIIADMGDGILVIGPDEEILTANPAAERMLGLDVPYVEPYCRLTDVRSLTPIADAFSLWRARLHGAAPGQADTPMYVVVKPGDEFSQHAPLTMRGSRREHGPHLLATHLQLRFASVETEGLSEDRTVIFLQDVSEIENKAQQLKLASMGRLTASIAHEVRNPLSAIAHASSLLGEEPANPMQARLLHIVADNVARLNRMIEDILKLSRKAQPYHEPLALGPFMADLIGEFREMHAVPAGVVELGRMDQYQVWFDPLHLREVVTNLLSNALRYASGKPGCIRVDALPGIADRLELHVRDDGPPISQEVRAHLFEPFYTTSSKGTGLGLYLARELCLNNGAIIDYEFRAEVADQNYGEASGRFVITFAATEAGGARMPEAQAPDAGRSAAGEAGFPIEH